MKELLELVCLKEIMTDGVNCILDNRLLSFRSEKSVYCIVNGFNNEVL